MGAWVIFRRARITLFCFLILICVTWATLFAVLLSHERSHFSRFQKITVISLLSLYGFTAIFLYLMAATQFRLWWDVGRLFALLVVHTGGSLLLTFDSPNFPCQNFGTETVCRNFVFAILIGSWVVSGIILILLIALGVMSFIPQSVKSSQKTEGVDTPSTPASFTAGSPMDEPRPSSFYSVDSRTAFVSSNNGGRSPNITPSPVSSAQGEGPPRLRLGFESTNLRHGNNNHPGPMSMRDSPTERTNFISGPRRDDPFHRSPLGIPSPPPASIYSRVPMGRPGVGGKNSPITENRPNPSSPFPGLNRDALSPISPHGSPTPLITPPNLNTENTPTPSLYSRPGYYPVATSPGDHSQREQTYPDRAQTRASSIYSFHSSAASVHTIWAEPTSHIPPLPALTPDTARFRGAASHLGPKVPSSGSGNNASFATGGLNGSAPLSAPHRTMQHDGALWAHQPYHPPVKESSFSRRDGDERQLDQTQWRRLVLNAAAKR